MKKSLSGAITTLKNIVKRDQKFTNKCKICNLELSDAQRTKKHMIKAHSKPKRENN